MSGPATNQRETMTPERKKQITKEINSFSPIKWGEDAWIFRAMLGEAMRHISFLEAKVEAQQECLDKPQ